MPTETLFEAFPQIDAGSHGGDVVQLLVAPDGQTLLSAGETTVRVWHTVAPADPSTNRLQRMLLGRVSGPTDDFAIDGRAERCAISRDGLWVVVLKPWRHEFAGDPAAGHDDGRVTEVQVFELANGNLQARFVWPGLLLDLDFSPDGNCLAAVGNAVIGQLRHAEVLVWATQELLREGARPAPAPLSRLVLPASHPVDTLPAALRFVPERQAYARPHTRSAGAATLVVATGDETDPWGEVAWLHWAPATGLVQARTLRTEVAIKAHTLAVSASTVAVAAAPFKGRKLRGQLLWFAHQGGHGNGAVHLEEPAASAAFSPSGARLALGLIGGDPGEASVQVDVFDCLLPRGPTLRSSYLGHDGTVHAVAFMDEDTVASAGGDNHAIHFWRPTRRIAEAHDAIRGVGRLAVAPGITANERVLFGTVPERLRPPLHPLRQQSFDLRHMALTTNATSKLRDDYASRKWWVGFENPDMVIPLWFRVDDMTPAELQTTTPDLSLFVGADDTWVIWTASGYYNAGGGAGAERRIGYRVNRGLHQEALLVPSDRFKAFYRPDIVQAVVRYGSESRAIARGCDIPVLDVTHILPPIAELAREDIRQEHGRVGLSFTIESPCPGYPVTRASLQRNGRVVWTKHEQPEPAPADAPQTATPPPSYGQLPQPMVPVRQRCVVPPLPLLPGRNRFAFHVENAKAKSVPVEFEIDVPVTDQGQGPSETALKAPGKLYLLSVGVAEFAHPSVPPLHCSHLDATAVVDAFAHARLPSGATQLQDAKNLAFESVDAKLLVNKQATKAAILHELDRMCTEIRQRHAQIGDERDVLFVFLSGHGTPFIRANVPSLFFTNYDIVPTAQEVENTGLSMLDLGDRITSVPAEVVLVIDACHAALAGRSTMAGLNAEELARRVHAIYERGMYLVCAARAEQLAQEDAEGMLGVLTGAMMEALRRARPAGAPATPSADGEPGTRGFEVLMAEIVSGVQRFVPEVSARTGVDAQTPVCRIYGDLLPLTMLKT